LKEHTKDRVVWALAGVLLLLVVLEAVLIPHTGPVFPWHSVPGYSAMIGLFGCIIVVLLSKWLGRTFLQRPEADV
jgi:uncharacterized membrane protein